MHRVGHGSKEDVSVGKLYKLLFFIKLNLWFDYAVYFSLINTSGNCLTF